MKQKSSLADYQEQKLNYDSDVGQRGRENLREKSPVVVDSKRRALEARAKKFRNAANAQNKKQSEDEDSNNDDVEPTKPDAGPTRQDRRQNHSI